MAYLIDHQAININVGSRTFNITSLDDSYSRITIRIARKTTATPGYFDDGVGLKIDSWISLDDGVTWLPWMGCTAVGGIHTRHEDGTEISETTVSAGMPPGTSRRYRITVTVTGARLVTLLTVEAD